MRPNHPLQLHSALLARPSALFAPSKAAAPTCAAVQRIQQFRLSFNRKASSCSSPSSKTIAPQLRLQIRSKPTSRYNSTISSNPPPPSTADRARKSGQVYNSHPNATEAAPIPDPTTSYAVPMSPAQTTTTTSPPLTSYASPNNTLTPPLLTWNAFLALRKTRRRYNLLSSVSTSLLTTSAGISVLAQQNIESAGLFGLDPFLVLGIATAGSGAVGWLMGPFVGNAVFGWVYRGRRAELAAKERDLYRRIKLHRVDPSSSSAGNPVPDYYGEKIGSVAEYRTWMKDQRAYNKRRQNFL